MLMQNPKNSHFRTYSLYRTSVTMRSLEILTQRIFNNLIKQNQKLESDSVLKQSTTVSSVNSPGSKVQRPLCPGSSVQSPMSRVQRPASRVQNPESRVQRPGSSVQSPASRAQRPEFGVQSPDSSVQRPESSVQSPASRVLRPTLASRVQEFRYAHFHYLLFNAYPL